jgi:RNA recognition motif-containing protein
MNKKLFVGNLPFSVTESSLSEKFSAYGTVESAKIITDRDTGRSKGFAFVEMATDDEATQAISQLNGSEMDGRAISVSEAKPQAPRENRGGGGGFRSGGGGGRSGGGGGRSGGGGGGSKRW